MRLHKTAICHTSARRAKPAVSLGDPSGSVFAPLLAHRSVTTPRSVLAPNRRILQFSASLVFLLVAVGIYWFTAHPVFAQTNDLAGLSTFENSGSGLATTDIRVTIGNIIRVFLGLLGVVAIVLILYAGFLLMTAAGNEEQVAKAKKLLANAVIGLVLVLSAFGIVSFILSRILSATTTDGTTEGDVGGDRVGGGGLTRANSFTVESVQPNGTVLIRNIVVRLNFTRDLDVTTVVPGTITVTKDVDKSVVDGDLAVRGQLVTFTPKTPCFASDPKKTQKCFEESTKYIVEAKADVIKSSGGEKLRCGSGFSRTNTCKETFTSGTAIDAENPTIGIDKPVNDGFVSDHALVPINFTASDDFGVSYAAITDGDGKTATLMPGSGVASTKTSPWQGSALWDTAGKIPGTTEYTLKAKAFDLDSNESTESVVKVKIRAAHCFNTRQDTNLTPATANETGIDCGGSDCGACTAGTGTGGTGTGGTGTGGTGTGTGTGGTGKQDGSACTTHAECAGGLCQNSICVTKPRIDTIDPVQGPPGTYVTLKGANFGTAGVVHFLSRTNPNDKGDGNIDFPSACGKGFWTPESVTVKVPNVPVDQDPANTDANKNMYDLSLAVGALASDPVPFKVQPGTPPPGICRLDPDNGPVGITVEASGDHFGAIKGKVVFLDNKIGGITSWSDQSVMSQVPVGAKSGSVYVGVPSGTGVAGGFTPSNNLLFTVQDCRSGVRCSSGEQCCGDGSCRTAGTCTQAAAACTFAWKFTTGATPGDDDSGGDDGGGGRDDGKCGLGQPCPPDKKCDAGLQFLDGVCQDTMPHVIEDRECTQESQSPSPYKDTKDACKEAQIAVRFTMDMHDAALTKIDSNDNIANVILTQCNSGGSLVPNDCKTPIGLTWSKWLAHDAFGEGAVYKPKVTPLKAGTWYRVTLNGDPGGIAGKDGALLDGDRNGEPGGDYAWTFLTRGANDVCSVESVLVSPGAATITAPNATQDFSGLLVGPKCNLLDDTGYTWQWASNSSKATVAPANPLGKTTARSGPSAAAETVNASGVDTPIDITATAGRTAADTKSDAGKLTIRFDAPRVVKRWPDCGAACSNAEVGVQFSLPISFQATSSSVDAVKIYACQPVSGTIATLKTSVETQSTTAKTEGDAAIQKGNAAKAVGDVATPGTNDPHATPIPTEQQEAAAAAAQAARKAATSARVAATAVTQLMVALGNKATTLQQGQATALAVKATEAETKAIEAEAASRASSAVRAGDAAVAAGNAANNVSTFATAIASATTTTVTECTAEKLVTPAIPLRTYTYNPTTRILRFYPLGGLRADTAYRVLVEAGGLTGIKGAEQSAGKDLNPAPNAFSYNGKPYYSWTFRTKKAPATCALADVSVEPTSFTSYVTGEQTRYSSVAFGAPDACNPAEGQRLDPMSYNWNWQSSKETVGRLLSPLLNLLPAAPAGPDNNIDPEQQVISVGVERGKTEDTTDIQALAGGKDGKGALKVVCGFTQDTQCNAFTLLHDAGQQRSCRPSRNIPDVCGVASNTCCGIRPNIIISNPATLIQLQLPNVTKDVCPNAALSLTFDQPMDPATFSGNIRLSKGVPKTPPQTGYNFTSVIGSVDSETVDGKTTVTFTPKTKLETSTAYRLDVMGDGFGGVPQSETEKIRNMYGVALANARTYFFVTKSTLCPVDRAKIHVVPPIKNERNQTIEHLDRFTCGRDDCPDDQQRTLGAEGKGNQHTYEAKAYDRSGQELTIGSVTWSKDPNDTTIALSAATGKKMSATSMVKNGEVEVTAEVIGSPAETGKVSRTLRVVSFMCENPWPSLAQFPWKDPETHFELFYCRDAGLPGRDDDLPDLKTPIAVPRVQGEDNFLKDFLLPVNE